MTLFVFNMSLPIKITVKNNVNIAEVFAILNSTEWYRWYMTSTFKILTTRS